MRDMLGMWRLLLVVLLLGVGLALVSPATAGGPDRALQTTAGHSGRIELAQLLVPRDRERVQQVTPGERPSPPASLSLWQRGQVWLQGTQHRFYRQLTQSLKTLRAEGSLAAGWSLGFISFLYGIFHAAGPGHGKAVISAYLLANERQLRRGIFLAFLSSAFQALSAIVIVSGALIFARAAFGTTRQLSHYLELASYALIAAMGAVMLYRSARQLFSRPAGTEVVPAEHGHDHHHDHHHDGDCGCGHVHMPAPGALDDDWSLRRALAISFAVGLRPCSGALIVLVFAAGIGIYAAGIGATFAMALGTAITVSAIAILAVGSRNLAFKLAGGSSTAYRWLTGGLGMLCGLALAILGLALFQASLGGPASPLL